MGSDEYMISSSLLFDLEPSRQKLKSVLNASTPESIQKRKITGKECCPTRTVDVKGSNVSAGKVTETK